MSALTHSAVVTVGIKRPLAVIQVPTISPGPDEICVRVHFVASTPLDLHQNDGGLLVTHPQVLGDCVAGTVVDLGTGVEKEGRLHKGDRVFGFTWRGCEEKGKEHKEKGMQEFATAGAWLFGKVPECVELEDAVTMPNNFVTAWHAFVTDLNIELPWPKPDDFVPDESEEPILIWGGSSSVGQYAIQLLRYYGYKNILSTASQKHHAHLRSLGVTKCYDYRDASVIEHISGAAPEGLKKVLDCIGSVEGSMKPISRLAKEGSKVAVLLPVILRDSSETENPEYAMDASAAVEWADGVEARGVRTHFYLENDFHKQYLQPEIMPTLLRRGVVRPNRFRLIQGDSLLERAQKALDMLRRKDVSGERLVWRVCEE